MLESPTWSIPLRPEEKAGLRVMKEPDRIGKVGRRMSEKGGTRLKGMYALLSWAFAGFLAWQLFPTFITNYQFQDVIKRAALHGSVQNWEVERVENTIIEEGAALGLNIRREQVVVQVRQKFVSIDVNYFQPVNMLVFTYHLHFNPSSVNRGL